MEHEHRRRRIHRKARAIHVGAPLAALVLPLAWLYATYGPCQESDSPLVVQACGALGWSPALPLLLAALVLAWLGWDLMHLGAATSEAPRPKLHHVRHGYRALEHHHRRHVRWAVYAAAAAGLATAAAAAYAAYRSTH